MSQSDEFCSKLTPVLGWTHDVSQLPRRQADTAFETAREATPGELAAVAAAMGVISCDALQTSYQIGARSKGRFMMRGSLKGKVNQACVVTLDPVPETVEEDFEVAFWPASQMETEPGEEIELGPDDLAKCEIEPINEDVLDAGRIIYEVLAAGIHPYPRASGVSFDAAEIGVAEEVKRENPFAVLGKLKGKG